MSRATIDYRKIGTDLAIGVGVAVVWFILSALLLWPFGKTALSAQLAKGFGLLVVAVPVAALGATLVHKLFRMETDPPRDPFVVVNILFSAFVQAGWAAFAALAVSSLTPGASLFGAAALHFVGLVASWVATATTAAFFQGSIYRTIGVLISFAGYLLFAAWPAAGRTLYGWFFACFER